MRRPEGGRPRSTSRADLERVAFDLFARHGFDETSVDAVATAAGIGRRTFFRYFASKADLVWGDYPELLHAMRTRLAGCPATVPVMDALRTATVEFNAVPPAAQALHRQRITLILTVPTLFANSTLRFRQWRAVVAEFVAQRLGAAPDDLLPVTVGYGALGASLAAYERWLAEPGSDLAVLLEQSFGLLAQGFREL